MRRLDDEQGAVAVFVAVSMAVLIAVLALVLDGGAIYGERRELQNGADAAALAIAEDCARGLLTCAAAPLLADSYADANGGRDLAADASLLEFDPLSTVTVRTSTNDGSGGNLLTFAFAPIFNLFGDGDYEGKTVDAVAKAVWGSPSKLGGLPITISACEYEHHTADGTVFMPTPILPGLGTPAVLPLHAGTSSTADECPHGPAGQDADGDGDVLPAGFGWLENVDCEVVTTAVGTTDWVSQSEGVNPECTADALEARLGTVLQLPVFGDFCRKNDPGCPTYDNSNKYEVLTFSGFHLTGFRLPSMAMAAPGWSVPSCGSGGFCIAGFFVKDVITGSGPLGGTPGGIVSISLVA